MRRLHWLMATMVIGTTTAAPAAASPPGPPLPVASSPPTPAERRAEAMKNAARIRSSADGSEQLAFWYRPDGAGPGDAGDAVPLLVVLHSWSGGFEQGVSYVGVARKKGWAFIAPDFRGPNSRPEACGSTLAMHDVIDAVEFAKTRARIDPKRVYLFGGSGGGHMALLMAARAPQIWAGVSTWVPITDLTAWHAESLAKKTGYAAMIEKCCGGPPGPATAVEYRRRSPLFGLEAASRVPVDINVGIHDGHTGTVLASHSLRAFDVLAQAAGMPDRGLTDDDIAFIVDRRQIPPSLAAETEADPERQKAVLFRRTVGQCRLTVFDGSHESETEAAMQWLSRQQLGQPADFSLGAGAAAVPSAVER